MTVLVFIALLAVLILVHEAGHFLWAKKEGVRVEEFAFGFPPRLWSRKIGETVYSLNLIPLGGYVRLYGEDRPKGKKSFASQPVWSRFKIVAGGVLMNLLLGYVFLIIYLALGNAPLATDPNSYPLWVLHYERKPVVLRVKKDSSAQEMGLKAGDVIEEVNGVLMGSAEAFAEFTSKHPGEKVRIKILRDGKQLEVEGKIEGREDKKGEIGVEVANYFARVNFRWWAIPLMAGIDLFNLVLLVLYFFWNLLLALFGQAQPLGTVVGPVGIYILTKEAVRLGFAHVLRLAIFLTVNLALINFLPLPALDGGRVLFLALEKIKGKRVRPEIENWVHLVGFVLIIALIVALTVKDVLKLF